ncbi:hypothetical protein HanRHA438_Chr13g0626661 [Helianthus annuus]|nr:hypothetical protein HanRHA438_Chr13g0626661 [Helianthus annuus]
MVLRSHTKLTTLPQSQDVTSGSSLGSFVIPINILYHQNHHLVLAGGPSKESI